MKEPIRHGVTRWTMPDVEWLEYQHFGLGKPFKQIADEVGCDRSTVQRWAKRFGISAKHFMGNGLHPPVKVGVGISARFYGVTREWLIQEYVKNDKSAKQIADEVKTSHHAVIEWLKKHSIPLRDREAMNHRHSRRMQGKGNPAWVNGNSQGYQKRKLRHSGKPKVCEWCGTAERLQIHHRDHDRTNHALDNLAWLCGTCNRLEAHLWSLQQSGQADVLIDQRGRKIEIRFTGG